MRLASPILPVVARFAIPLTVAVSVVIFFQGHNWPGGGFIAGVMAAAAGAMHLMAFGVGRALQVAWWRVSVVGLAIALATGLGPMLFGRTLFDHTTWDLHLPLGIDLHLPTSTFFDIGVYLIVLGTLMTILVELGAEES